MKIYVSHPIAGISESQRALIQAIATTHVVEKMHGEPILPLKIGPACGVQPDPPNTWCGIEGRHIGDDPHSVQCYMRGDIAEMLTCDAVLVMPGWQQSAGCRDEVNVAAMCGVPVYFYGDHS